MQLDRYERFDCGCGKRCSQAQKIKAQDLATLLMKMCNASTGSQLYTSLVRFSSLYSVPILQGLLLPFLKHYLEAVAGAVKQDDGSGPADDSECSSLKMLYSSSLTSYIERYVGRAPVKPSRWSRQPQGCKKIDCSPCNIMDAFLVDPELQTLRLSPVRGNISSYSIRHHSVKRDYESHKTVAWTITKADTAEFDDVEREWTRRRADAAFILGELDQETLERILGEESMKEIMAMRCIEEERAPGSSE